MKLYLAGPMSGIEHYNFPAFDKAAALLRDAGHTVFNPAANDRANGFDAILLDLKGHEGAEYGFDLRETLKQDLSWICDHADAIALLPKWQNSKGASAEVALANALGIPWANVPEFVTGKYRRKLSMAIASP
jgi:hypothetical protein